jgi:hypothetical protein
LAKGLGLTEALWLTQTLWLTEALLLTEALWLAKSLWLAEILWLTELWLARLWLTKGVGLLTGDARLLLRRPLLTGESCRGVVQLPTLIRRAERVDAGLQGIANGPAVTAPVELDHLAGSRRKVLFETGLKRVTLTIDGERQGGVVVGGVHDSHRPGHG